MFPWQSGSDGQKETQAFNLNPRSQRWVRDNSHLQRHIGSAITYNVWHCFQVTHDLEFRHSYGAELILDIAHFWSSIASFNDGRGRYEIRGVMGPDEFHDAYPESATAGINNNAYTNIMAVWVLCRALEVLDLLSDMRRAELTTRLGISAEEIARWREISRRMVVPFHDDGITSRTLAARDPSHRGFYERRAAELDHMVVDLPDDPPARVDPSELREAALGAADGADFDAVLRIARDTARSGRDRMGRIRVPRPPPGRIERLAEPMPDGVVRRAAGLGLEPAKLEAKGALNAYLSCDCASRAILPSVPLTEERRELEGCTCGHACPPEVGKSLKSSLDALLVHPFPTSGGTRYLPWFGAEVLLVESFSEEEPDAPTPLLESLSLPRRRGLARRFALVGRDRFEAREPRHGG